MSFSKYMELCLTHPIHGYYINPANPVFGPSGDFITSPEISQVFEITVKGRQKTSIAGCKVRNGMIQRAKKVRVLRGQEIVYDGRYRLFICI